MQNSQSKKGFKLFHTLFLALPAMLSLFSCSKNSNDLAAGESGIPNLSAPSSHTIVETSVESIPFDRTFYVPCANGGDGEEVQLKGTIRIGHHVVRNKNRVTLTNTSNFQGVSGVGLTTGDKYQASSSQPGTLTGSMQNGQFTAFYIEPIRIVSKNVTYKVNYKFHVTINAGGIYTAYISEETESCRN